MELNKLIEEATEIAGSLRKLSAILELNPSNLIEMRQGKRKANWRVRGGLRAVLGEDPARAYMIAMAEDLEQSEKADEIKAAEGFKAILAAFPAENQKAPSAQVTQGSNWRKRMFTPIRWLLTTYPVNRPLRYGW